MLPVPCPGGCKPTCGFVPFLLVGKRHHGLGKLFVFGVLIFLPSPNLIFFCGHGWRCPRCSAGGEAEVTAGAGTDPLLCQARALAPRKRSSLKNASFLAMASVAVALTCVQSWMTASGPIKTVELSFASQTSRIAITAIGHMKQTCTPRLADC